MKFVTLLAAATGIITSLTPASPVRVNGIAAKANGEVITMNELMIELGPVQSVLMTRFPRRAAAYQAQLKRQRDRILDELIDRAIIYSEYKDRITAIPERAVEEDIRRHIDQVFAGDDKLFRQFLEKTKLTRAKFKENQRKELLVSIVRNQQFPDLPPPTKAELQKEYAEWKIANRDRKKDVGTYYKIRIPKGFDREASLKRAEDLVTQIKAGADFSELARKYSIDAQAAEGGLWKDVPRTDLNHDFGVILFDMEGDDIIGPLPDPFGFTIMKVVKRNFGPAPPLAQVEDKITEVINAKKKAAAFEAWMKKLRDRVPIQKMIE